MKKPPGMRALPHQILDPTFVDRKHWEAQEVHNKYSDPAARVGEENVDYEAMNYMNGEAQLYWLPIFFDYLQGDAPRDSYHYDVMLFRLSREDFSGPLLLLATRHECARVLEYLDWLEQQPGLIDDVTRRREQHAIARSIWSSHRPE